MVRRTDPPFYGHRYVGDKRKRLVHDMERETGGVRGCRILEILLPDVEIFEPDTLREAYRHGYEFCPCCIGET
jgi:hypothetical protein